MDENTLKPQLRFKGFADAWEQRKLGELGKCQSGIGFPDAEQGGKLGIPFYKVSDMNNYGNEIEMKCANNYVTEKQIIKYNWKTVKELPAIIFAKVGAAIMLNRKRLCRFEFLLDNNTMAYKLGKNWDTNFAKTIFEKVDLTTLVQVGALPSYNATDVENMDVTISLSSLEQSKIGEFFSNLDNLITLHQRKLDKLGNIKKALLEKMFPKEGSTIPEIRFKGFTDAWEQRKLCTLTNYKNGKGHESQQLDSGKYELINLNSISIDGGLKSSGKFINETNETLLKNDLVMVLSDVAHGDLLGRVAKIPENNRYVLNQRVALLRPYEGENSTFLFVCINASQSYFKQLGAGSSQLNISKNTVETFSPYIPKNSEEQSKIGEFFSNLDNLITLHQRKLEKLKNIKKACLEKMFV